MMQLETAVQIAGHSLVALQGSAQNSSFFSNAGFWWYQTQTNLNAMLTNTETMPFEVIAAARALGVKKPLLIHQFLSPEADETDCNRRFAAAGYVLTNRHHLMICALTPQPELPVPWKIFRAENQKQIRQISRAAKEILLNPTQLPPLPIGVRLYAAQTSNQIIGWARVAQLQPQTTWLDDLFTVVAWRKRGVMASILQRTTQEALAFGAQDMLLFSGEHNFEYHLGHGYSTVAIKLRFAAPPTWFERIKNKLRAS
jgi:hypothetical protein